MFRVVKDRLLQHVRESSDLDSYRAAVREAIAHGGPRPHFSNTEILAGAALVGASTSGAEIDYFPLSRVFPTAERSIFEFEADKLGLDESALSRDYLRINEKTKGELLAKIESADGIVITSPVYFGDRSSIANKVLQLAQQHDLFQGKFVASISCGAKRNGGQETTNIFTLHEALQMDAFVVGNGPSTCQYGGTAWAGDLGKVLDDDFGLQTSFATGVRLGQVAALAHGQEPPDDLPVRIVVLVTMDTPQKLLEDLIKQQLKTLPAQGILFDVVNLIDGHIERCLACNICPIPEKLGSDAKAPYACIIETKRDTMDYLREVLYRADGLIIAGLSLRDMQEVVYRYQAFTERTRFIRRNDFELTNLPMTSFTLKEVGAPHNSIFDLKVMTSYIRHNTILCPPIFHHQFDGRTLVDSKEGLAQFTRTVQIFSARRDQLQKVPVGYKAGRLGGYRDTRLDHTFALRS